jgi:hypothetical protein
VPNLVGNTHCVRNAVGEPDDFNLPRSVPPFGLNLVYQGAGRVINVRVVEGEVNMLERRSMFICGPRSMRAHCRP